MLGRLALAPCLVPLGHRVPVYNIPPRRHVGWPRVLVFEVVRVLPDVDAHDWVSSLGIRAVLIRGALNSQRSVWTQRKPGPARSKSSGGGRSDLCLEGVERAKRGIDRVSQRSGRLAAGVRPHALPQHRAICVADTVVPDPATVL